MTYIKEKDKEKEEDLARLDKGDGIPYDRLQALQNLQSEEKPSEAHDVRVNVSNTSFNISFSFYMRAGDKVADLLNKISIRMEIPQHSLKIGVAGKELTLKTDGFYPVSTFSSFSQEHGSTIDAVVIFAIKLRGGAPSRP